KIFEGYSLSEAVLHKRGIIKNISATDPELATLEKNLRVLMETEKLYKEEDINLESLAKKVGVSRHLLSGAINSTGMNFFEYVNYWRIEEAKKLLSGTSKKELNVIEVAYEVGFNN